MRFSFFFGTFLGWATWTVAVPLEHTKRQSCANGPTARNCWGDFSIDDDVTYTWPDTGVTRSYSFDVGLATLAPDGVEKVMMVVNGQYPGPTIEANWGDSVQVEVCNNLSQNGTSIHFHGVRHLNTNHADGAVSQTECPIAPGDCHTYRFKATQHGSSWYHSHYSLQYGDGLLGAIVIRGPTTANWDIDLGPLLITDHYHESVFDLADEPLTSLIGIPPVAVNGLMNGKNAYLTGTGSRAEFTFTPGKKHLLRLVNTGSEMIFRFAVDQHRMTVVAMDFIPIQPFETDTLLIAIGQRYDVIIEADQSPDVAYWARGVPMTSCFAINLMSTDIRAIVRYESDTPVTGDPTSTSWLMLDTCADEDLSNLVPHITHSVGPSALTQNFNAVLLPSQGDNYAVRWRVGGSEPYRPPKNNPVVKQVIDTAAVNLTADFNPIDLTSLAPSSWVYLIVESLAPLPHPLHLHGHDTYVLARGTGPYVELLTSLDLESPPRRDTFNLPQSGYVVLAFQTDNPGSWLLHCHIQWHIHQGFALTLVEGSPSSIQGVYGSGEDAEMRRICQNWGSSGLETTD
ncbi:hypothetical protein QC762_610630 [Podospora pseudocomata]|uniref:Laccase n=1 Tax=Podospora pseudocomata TaxID=2093779 RepID=A0ABR0G9G4_9PEZI|nr:hypothetical protein QC762_610630 [Podospora pseudocomata]